jgi:hypothetical protein
LRWHDPGRHAWADNEAGMSDWYEFTEQLLDALRRFAQGDAEPPKSLWSHRDDVTIFGGWGAPTSRAGPWSSRAWTGLPPGIPRAG